MAYRAHLDLNSGRFHVSHRKLCQLHNLDRGCFGPRADRRLARLPAGLLENGFPALRIVEQTIDASAHHRDGRTHSIGDLRVRGTKHFRGPAQRPVEQHRTPADQDHRNGSAARLHLVDGILDTALDTIQYVRHGGGVQIRHTRGISDTYLSRAHGNIRGRELRAPEYERALGQLIPHGIRSDGDGSIFHPHTRSTTQGYREDFRHAEIRTHPPDQVRCRRFPGEALDQKAEVGRGATDIDDNGILTKQYIYLRL